MNNIAKLSIGLVTTGTVATGAFFASSLLSKGKEQTDSETLTTDSKKESTPILSPAVIQKRKKHRVDSIKSVFTHYQSNEEAKREIAKMIDGRDKAEITVFAMQNGNFLDSDSVIAATDSWCEKDGDFKETLDKYKEINRGEICNKKDFPN